MQPRAGLDPDVVVEEGKAVVSCLKTQCDPLDAMTGGSSSGGSSGAFGASGSSSASAFSAISARVHAARSAGQP